MLDHRRARQHRRIRQAGTEHELVPDRRLALRIPDLAVPVAKHHGSAAADIQLSLAHQLELQGKTSGDGDVVGIHAGDVVASCDRNAGV